MKKLEIILFVGAITALILKFSLISGGDFMTLLTMLFLAGLYYPLGFLVLNQIRLRDVFKKEAYKGISGLRILLAIIAGLGLSTIIIGMLFKLLNFAGADSMLLIGLFITTVVFILSLILFIKNKDTNSKFILWRVSIIGLIGLFMFLTPELAIVKFQYRNHPRYMEAYTKYIADPQNEALYQQVQLERNRIRLSDEDFKKYEESVSAQKSE